MLRLKRLYLKISLNSIEKNNITVKAPIELDNLLLQNSMKENNEPEFDNKFALPKLVDIDLIKESKVVEIGSYLFYNMSISAENALNLSLVFKEFHLITIAQ